MNVAIAVDNKKVSGHFGHCQGFQMYGLDKGKIIRESFLENPGHQPGVLPKFLAHHQTDVIIAGGMGGSAQALFKSHNIEVLVGAQGMMDQVIQAYLSGDLVSSQAVCSAHSHEDSCGNH